VVVAAPQSGQAQVVSATRRAVVYLCDDRSMRLSPLYRSHFTYREGWSVPLSDNHGQATQHYLLAEGGCEGRISGRLLGTNHPRQRDDGTFEADFQGVIETDDGAVIYFDFRGYGRTHPVDRRQIVGSVTHLSDFADYRWLNDSVAVAVGEVRANEATTELVIDVAELVWEQPQP
jgi:hypothetical protein